jgi:hypothetical protein
MKRLEVDMIGKTIHRGQALALIMVAIFGILALTALAIDGGNAFGDRRKAQSAADNSAIAAALALTDKNSSTIYTTEALKITQANSRPDDTVTVSYPPGTGCDGAAFSYAGLYDADPAHYVGVVIHSTVPTFFGPVIGIDTVSHCVEAVARAKPEEPGEAFPGTAIVALRCVDNRTFDAFGNGVLHVEDGGIFVNSYSSTALYSGGSSEVWSPSYTVVGGDNHGNFLNEDGTGPGVITNGVLPFACPSTIKFDIPAAACADNSTQDGTGTYSVGSTTYTIPKYNPGIISQTEIKKGAFLKPGIYCVSGSLKLTSDYLLKGDGVLLYFMDGGWDMSGSSTIQLTPYVDDPFKIGSLNKLLVYSEVTNTSEFKWNGTSQSYFSGSIVILGSHMIINGTGSEEGWKAQIIADTVAWGGTGDGYIIYDDNVIARPTLQAEIELIR